MKNIILLFSIAAVTGIHCKKDKKCPGNTDIGCGCYNTGNPSEPGTANGWTPAYWRVSSQECYWVNTLGNEYLISASNCSCR